MEKEYGKYYKTFEEFAETYRKINLQSFFSTEPINSLSISEQEKIMNFYTTLEKVNIIQVYIKAEKFFLTCLQEFLENKNYWPDFKAGQTSAFVKIYSDENISELLNIFIESFKNKILLKSLGITFMDKNYLWFYYFIEKNQFLVSRKFNSTYLHDFIFQASPAPLKAFDSTLVNVIEFINETTRNK